jgi:pSer/pThr/pTyr-binding forkhead associated (FHA) protein
LKAEQERIATERAALPAPPGEEILDTARRAAISTARLVVQRGPNAGETFALQSGVNIIGRTSGAAIRLTDVLISRQHVRLNVEAKHVTLEDLGSANGTFVNAQKIGDAAPVTLHDGDTIAIGDTVLVFQSTARMPATQPKEPRVAPPAELQTMIAEAPPPKSFADQLVADQSTRLSPATELQSGATIAAQLKLIAVPTLIAASGFGLTYGIMAQLISSALGSMVGAILLLAAAAVIPWVTITLALRRMGVVVAWRWIIAVILGWGLAGGLGLGAVSILSSTLNSSGSVDERTFAFTLVIVFGVVVGFIGGQLTARILRVPVPSLRLARTTIGWTIAWVAGMIVMLLISLSQ